MPDSSQSSGPWSRPASPRALSRHAFDRHHQHPRQQRGEVGGHEQQHDEGGRRAQHLEQRRPVAASGSADDGGEVYARAPGGIGGEQRLDFAVVVEEQGGEVDGAGADQAEEEGVT